MPGSLNVLDVVEDRDQLYSKRITLLDKRMQDIPSSIPFDLLIQIKGAHILKTWKDLRWR
jgi:hypothetical protein